MSTAVPERGPWDRWERTRRMGKQAFIWRFGVFGWGLLMTLVFLAVAVADQRNGPGSGNLYVLAPILGFSGGYVWGLLMWHATEQKYQNYAMLREIRDRLREQDRTGHPEPPY
jgi:hypothetical protein